MGCHSDSHRILGSTGNCTRRLPLTQSKAGLLLEIAYSALFFSHSNTSETATLRILVKVFLVHFSALLPFSAKKSKGKQDLCLGSKSQRGPVVDELHIESLLRLWISE